MNVFIVRSVMLASVVILSGCASVPLPPEAAAVALVPVSSVSVEIHRPRFKMKNGDLMLEAYALRQWKAETTADTHVDIVFLDGLGKQVAVETANFHPRSLPKTMRLPGPHANFIVSIQLPAGARAIEVRAHDGAHEMQPATQRPLSTPN